MNIGRTSAAVASRPRPDRDRADHGVIGTGLDRPVVNQQQVRDSRQPRERVVVAVGDRLVGHVAARHHQRGSRADPRAAGDAAASTGASRPARARRAPPTARPARLRRAAAASTIGRCGAYSSARSASPSSTSPRRRPARRDHQGERLVLSVLARAQGAHRRLVIGAAGEVKAADPLDRDDRALAQARSARREHRDHPSHAPSRAASRPCGSISRTDGPHSGHAFGWA